MHVRVAMLMLVWVVGFGCGDECRPSESECDGLQVKTCDEGDVGGYAFRGLGDCCAGSTCRDLMSGSDRVAVCSDSASPDPSCSTVGSGFGTVCADPTTLLGCGYGYSRVVETCTDVCVDQGDGKAFCAQAATDARCAGVDYGIICAGSTLLKCDAGARLDETACATACVDLGNNNAFCSTSATPDPRCPAMVAWCDSNAAMSCNEGYVSVETCDAGETCTVSTLPDGTVLSAFCDSPSMPNACAAYQ
jgi:hypothetical protein